MQVPEVECHPGIKNTGLRPFTRISLQSSSEGESLVAMPVGTAVKGGRPVRLWLYLLVNGKGLDRVISAMATHADISLDDEYRELVANTDDLMEKMTLEYAPAPKAMH